MDTIIVSLIISITLSPCKLKIENVENKTVFMTHYGIKWMALNQSAHWVAM